MIIVHENNLEKRAASVEESFINNVQEKDVKDENDEANIAIELLDTVLEAASDEMANLSQSINDNFVEEIEVAETEHNNDYNSTENQCENESIKIMGNRMNDINRDEIESEIDEILRKAILSIAENEKVELDLTDENETISDSDSPENVFQNHEFLSHLNELISKSSTNQVSKTMTRRKPSTLSLKVLRHSKSVPNFEVVSVKNELRDNDNNIEMHDTDKNENKIPHPPPLPLNTEVTASSYIPRMNREKIDDESLVINKDFVEVEDEHDEEEVTVNRENIRDKLEKLLQSASLRLTLNAPIPLPRTKFDENVIPVSPEVNLDTIKSKQKLLFTEVLKSIPHAHNDKDYNNDENNDVDVDEKNA